MNKKKNNQKNLSNENHKISNETKLNKVSGGTNFTFGNFEKKTENIWIKETGIPKD